MWSKKMIRESKLAQLLLEDKMKWEDQEVRAE